MIWVPDFTFAGVHNRFFCFRPAAHGHGHGHSRRPRPAGHSEPATAYGAEYRTQEGAKEEEEEEAAQKEQQQQQRKKKQQSHKQKMQQKLDDRVARKHSR